VCAHSSASGGGGCDGSAIGRGTHQVGLVSQLAVTIKAKRGGGERGCAQRRAPLCAQRRAPLSAGRGFQMRKHVVQRRRGARALGVPCGGAERKGRVRSLPLLLFRGGAPRALFSRGTGTRPLRPRPRAVAATATAT